MEPLWNSSDKVDMIRLVAQWLAVISTIIALVFSMRFSIIKKEAETAKEKAEAEIRILFENKIQTASSILDKTNIKISEIEKKSKPRTITPDEGTIIQAELIKHSGEFITIKCIANDAEAFSFASQLHVLFQNAGWSVPTIESFIYVGKPRRGLTIRIKDKSLEYKADYIFQLLHLAKDPSIGEILGEIDSEQKYDISLLVGPK